MTQSLSPAATAMRCPVCDRSGASPAMSRLRSASTSNLHHPIRRLAKNQSRSALADARATVHAGDLAAITSFAHTNGLTVEDSDAGRRLIRLAGAASAMEKAFGTELHRYEGDGHICRGRHGVLHVPREIAHRLTAVLGLDTRPIATPKIVPHRGPTPPTGFLPTEVAQLYGFDDVDASGQCIGIIELGGGYTDADNQAAFKAMALAMPDIVAVGVDGASNDPADTSGANGEVALDIQVAGGVAPGAAIAVYFAPNTDQGFVDAISQAVHDQTNAPSVLSISWGSAESGWTAQADRGDGSGVPGCGAARRHRLRRLGRRPRHRRRQRRQGACRLSCLRPAGAGLRRHEDHGLGAQITGETVWKSNGGGTGGGVSSLFALPAYQADAGVPKASAKTGGRGVPDVAGDADPDSGYRIVTGGQIGIIGGTSAVAPLWAGIIAGLNAKRTAALGQLHARLYANHAAFRDIISGDNKVWRHRLRGASGMGRMYRSRITQRRQIEGVACEGLSMDDPTSGSWMAADTRATPLCGKTKLIADSEHRVMKETTPPLAGLVEAPSAARSGLSRVRIPLSRHHAHPRWLHAGFRMRRRDAADRDAQRSSLSIGRPADALRAVHRRGVRPGGLPRRLRQHLHPPVLPPGTTKLSCDFVIEDSGEPDPQHQRRSTTRRAVCLPRS